MGKRRPYPSAATTAFKVIICWVVLTDSLLDAKTIAVNMPCYDSEIHITISTPYNKNNIGVFLVPTSKYMDGAGRFGSAHRNQVPEEGFFNHIRPFLLKKGFTTIQFDKPGTGKSSGVLTQEEELALLCAFSVWDSLENTFTANYMIFAYGEGGQYFRYALRALQASTQDARPLGMIQFSGLYNLHFLTQRNPIPILSLVGDTTQLSDPFYRVHSEIFSKKDSLSKVIYFPDVNPFLCRYESVKNQGRCTYPAQMYGMITNWMISSSNFAQQSTDEENIMNEDW